MHLIRRSAFRAIVSPEASFLSKPRSITTSSPFTIRPKLHASISPICRRFASDDATVEAKKAETESGSLEDPKDQSAPKPASSGEESLTGNASAANNVAADTTSNFAEAAGPAFARRMTPRDNYGSGRQSGFTRVQQERNREHALQALQPTNSLYVGNLLFDITEEDLSREFAEYGNINKVVIARDARGLSKGFGYVTYDSINAATDARQAKDQTILQGRRIVVNYQLKTTRPPGQNPPSSTVFIGNLAFEMSDADLNRLFKDIKNVMDVRVAIDRRTGQPRGFAHADFMDVESAKKGLEYLRGKEFYGRALRVDFAASPATIRTPPSEGGS